MGLPFLAGAIGQPAPRYPGALSVMGIPPFAGADPVALAAAEGDPAMLPGVAGGTAPKQRGTGLVAPHPAVMQASLAAQAPQRGFAEVVDPATGMPAQRPSGGFGAMIDPAAAAQPKHGFAAFLDRALNPTNALGQFGRALVIAGGTPIGTAFQVMDADKARQQAAAIERARYERENAWHEQARQDHIDDQTYERTKPQFFSGNEDRIMFDPTTGETKTVFDAPTDAETYARDLGIEPGSKEWGEALQDYVLRGSGPTAFGYRSSLEGQRQDNRVSLRGMPTYRDMHRPAPGALAPRGSGSGGSRTMAGVIAPILGKVAGGKPLTAGEQQAYEMYRSRGRGGGRGKDGGAVPEGATATGPGGKKMIRRGGQWVPLNG